MRQNLDKNGWKQRDKLKLLLYSQILQEVNTSDNVYQDLRLHCITMFSQPLPLLLGVWHTNIHSKERKSKKLGGHTVNSLELDFNIVYCINYNIISHTDE